MKLPVYMDYQATTPMDPRVIKKVTEVMENNFGNPHSQTHKFGWEALEVCEIAREQVASLIGAEAKEIIFTSGATESNNLAISGLAKFHGSKKNHIITVATEHKCVIEACRHLGEQGFEITFLPVQKNGIIDLDVLKNAITDKTLLVSIMAVNNEIGVIQPLKEIGAICRENGVYFHTDAAQAFGKIPLDVEEMNIDMMSISGHKIYGPKGIGALYIRRKPRVRILPMIHGGGQERGFRSGTLPTPIVAGLGEAARIAKNEMEGEYVRITGFYNQLKASILDGTEAVFLNGDPVVRYYGNLNISFGYIEGESMIMAIKDIAVSSGSACTSASLEASYVLKALGVQEDLAHTSIRFGIGRFTTQEQIDYVITRLKSEIDNLRNLSPLWEMYKEGIDISKIQWAGEHHSGNKMSDFDKVICGVN